jgi:hypothetical protein
MPTQVGIHDFPWCTPRGRGWRAFAHHDEGESVFQRVGISYGNKLGIIDIQYQLVMSAAALAAGGTGHDLEPSKKVLLELHKANVRIYPTSEAFAEGLKSKEGTFPST